MKSLIINNQKIMNEKLFEKLLSTVENSQKVLLEWILPDSSVTDREVIYQLLEILDSKELVSMMRGTEEKPEELVHTWEDSPNIARAAFFPSLDILQIEYRDGHIYQYKFVNQTIWEELIQAESPGAFLHRFVKGKYSYVQTR